MLEGRGLRELQALDRAALFEGVRKALHPPA
jgi:hypothetical protein